MIEEDMQDYEEYSFTGEFTAAELEEKVLVDDTTEEQEESSGYFTTIAEQICETYESLKQAEKKEIVPILGITGAGKSTLINYLSGCDMQLKKDEYGIDIALPKPGFENKVLAEIGYDASESKTKKPVVYKTKDGMFTYCDSPGFFDTEGGGAQITTSFGIQIAVSLAEQIKAIVIVISWSDFNPEGKGKRVKELSSIIAQLLNNFKEMNNSILFMINRVPYDIPERNNPEAFRKLMIRKIGLIHKAEYNRFCKLKRKIAGCKKEGNTEKKGKLELEQETIIKTLVFLKFMKTCEISMLDVFDSARRKSILNSLSACHPIKGVSNFNFACADARKEFDEELYEFANKGTELIQNLKSLPEKIERKEQLIQDLEKSLINLNKDKEDIESGRKITEQELFNKRNTKLLEIKEKDKKIADISEKLVSLKRDKGKLRNELETLDTDDPVYYKKGSPPIIDDKRYYQQVKDIPSIKEMWTDEDLPVKIFGIPLALTTIATVVPIASLVSLFCKTRQEIKYKGIPFVGIEEICENGEFLKKEIDKEKGLYKAIYESDRGKAGFAQVKIYVEKRLLPENKARIEGINAELTNLRETKKNYKGDKKRYEEIKKTLQEEHAQLQQQEKLNKEEMLKNIESQIDKKQRSLNEVKSELETLNQEQETTTQNWNSHQKLFKAIAMIIRCIGYNEKVCQVFLKEYEEYMNAQKPQAAKKRAPSEVKAPPLSSHPSSFHATNASAPTKQQPDSESIPTMAPGI